MPRTTVYHLTKPRWLPLIEERGLRTRADMSSVLGQIDEVDAAAPGTYARGKRVTGWLSLDHARTTVSRFGHGLVSYSVDPAKTLAAPASQRGDVQRYWDDAKPLASWLELATCPDDLEVHQNVAVRAKHVRLHAPLFVDDDLGDYAPLIGAVADEDRLSAKALMHVAIIASNGDFDSTEFAVACALAWRDESDEPGLIRELLDTDPDKVASAAIAAYGGAATDATARLRDVLEETRSWADDAGYEPGQGLLERSGAILDQLDRR